MGEPFQQHDLTVRQFDRLHSIVLATNSGNKLEVGQ